MACNCGNKGKAAVVYVVTGPDGKKQSFTSEVAASVAAKRVGGTYRKAAS